MLISNASKIENEKILHFFAEKKSKKNQNAEIKVLNSKIIKFKLEVGKNGESFRYYVTFKLKSF